MSLTKTQLYEERNAFILNATYKLMKKGYDRSEAEDMAYELLADHESRERW